MQKLRYGDLTIKEIKMTCDVWNIETFHFMNWNLLKVYHQMAWQQLSIKLAFKQRNEYPDFF